MYKKYCLSWTLKIHVILDHYQEYFEKMNKTMRHTNGEFPEGVHSTLIKRERANGNHVVRKIATPIHQQRALSSLTIFNSKNIGYIHPIRLRKANTPSPRSSPFTSRSPFSNNFKERYPESVEEHNKMFNKI